MAGTDPMTVVNNIIANNISTHEGGGVAIDDTSDVRLVNDTIAKNMTTATAVTSDGSMAPAGVSTGANSALLRAALPGHPGLQQPDDVQRHLLGQPRRHPRRVTRSPASASTATRPRSSTGTSARPMRPGPRPRSTRCSRSPTARRTTRPTDTASTRRSSPSSTRRSRSCRGARTRTSSARSWSSPMCRRPSWATTTSRRRRRLTIPPPPYSAASLGSIAAPAVDIDGQARPASAPRSTSAPTRSTRPAAGRAAGGAACRATCRPTGRATGRASGRPTGRASGHPTGQRSSRRRCSWTPSSGPAAVSAPSGAAPPPERTSGSSRTASRCGPGAWSGGRPERLRARTRKPSSP